MQKQFKVLQVITHPIQYQAPFYKQASLDPEIDLTVLFYWNKENDARFDDKFNRKITWDVPLFEGYKFKFLSEIAKSTDMFKKIMMLWKYINKKEVDVLWAHGYTDIYTQCAIIFAKLKGIPIVTRGDSIILPDRKITFKKKLQFAILNKIINRFLAVGTENLKYYVACGIPREKIVMCPYAVDNVFFREKSNAARAQLAQIKSELNIDEHAPIILYAGKFSPGKRPTDLLDAYIRLLNDTKQKIYFLLVGTGEIELLLLEKSKPYADTIRFLGFKNQSEMPTYYALADIIVMPSMHEKWGLVVNESMNAGCAVIVTDHVGCRTDLVQPGVNGFIYSMGDVAALTDCLKKIVTDAVLCASMKKKSVEKIAQWSFTETTAGLKEACHSLCAE